MKNLVSIVLAVAFASGILIGCDFVDSNPNYVEPDESAQIEASYDGYFATTVDTTGYDDGEGNGNDGNPPN